MNELNYDELATLIRPRVVKLDRPITSYYGGKAKLASWIAKKFGQHEIYAEPFAGMASVFFVKQPVKLEALNDLDGEIVNFFKMLRDRPNELIYKIWATPYSQFEYATSWQATDDPLEQARRTFIKLRQSYGSNLKQKGGWLKGLGRGQTITSAAQNNGIGHLFAAAERLRAAEIHQRDALDFISLFADNSRALLYVDPPYVIETMRDSTLYYNFTVDHRHLAEALHACQGAVFLSGYDGTLYADLYPDWLRLEKKALNLHKDPTLEVLWWNRKGAANWITQPALF
jgi:DNA adenine methylase